MCKNTAADVSAHQDIPADASALHPLVSTYRRVAQTSRDLAPGSLAPGSGPGSLAQPAHGSPATTGGKFMSCWELSRMFEHGRCRFLAASPGAAARPCCRGPRTTAGGLPRGPTERHARYPAADGGPDCTSLHFTTPQHHHGGCHSGTAGDKVLSDKRLSFHPCFQNIELVLVVCSGACTCRHMQVMGRDTTPARSMTDMSDKVEHDRDMTGSNLVARTGLGTVQTPASQHVGTRFPGN